MPINIPYEPRKSTITKSEHVIPPPLSPAAQAVLDAFRSGHTGPGCLAAALRAAAEQVVLPKYQYSDWKMADLIMREIQTVADELDEL